MANKILSIAIPTYNMEHYLERCLDSLVATQKIDILEIIVVNDGSTDRSAEIAHRYADEYPASIIVIDKENGNYGSCVNAALKIASGKYFRVLDADDWFDTEGLEQFLDKLKNVTVDAIVTHYTKEFVKRNQTECIKTAFKHFNEIIPADSTLLLEVDINTDFVMHKLTYRTEFLRNIAYFQTEGISYTDTEYVYYPLLHIQNIIFYDLVLYRYYIGREGQTISIPSQIKHTDDMYAILQRMMKSTLPINNNAFFEKVQSTLLTTFFASYYWSILVIQKLTSINNKKLKCLDSLLKEWNGKVYANLDSIKCLGIRYIRYWHKRNATIIHYKIYQYLRHWFIA